ncbi:MAG: hypothetical protein JNM88_16755, partial [Chitinophagaceae bacterium]|nr:hypothetical protein [Chitinophagaceae bacterium]
MKQSFIKNILAGSLLVLLAACGKEDTPAPVPALAFTQKTITSTIFAPLIEHSAVSFNGKLWVIGGRSGATYRNEIWNSADGAAWSPVAITGPVFPIRSAHKVLVFNNKLWIIAGLSNAVALNDVWSSA